jgi:LexA-binding, inner membrane-associated putative hydrolase
MGNYRQHMAFSSTLGVLYAAGTFVLGGVHWVYGTVAALLATLGGLLPDLDHPVGVELKGFTGILGVLTAVAVWYRVGRGIPDLPFELHMWLALLSFVFVRHGLRRTLTRLMVHRGISHSFPTCAVWGAAVYLSYPSDSPLIRLTMAAAVILGFLSHLVLDEMFSVDLSGARIKRSFGTAMKFWAPSLTATLAMYGLLSVLTYRVVKDWPDESVRQVLAEQPPPLRVPWDEIRTFRSKVGSEIRQGLPRPPEKSDGERVNRDDLPAPVRPPGVARREPTRGPS